MCAFGVNNNNYYVVVIFICVYAWCGYALYVHLCCPLAICIIVHGQHVCVLRCCICVIITFVHVEKKSCVCGKYIKETIGLAPSKYVRLIDENTARFNTIIFFSKKTCKILLN